MNKLYSDLKSKFEQLKIERGQYQQQLVDAYTSKKELEASYEARMQDMKRLTEAQQRELNTLAQKMSLPIDSDILRMRVQKDVEAKYRLELETRGMELEKMADAFYEAKRQLEIYKTSLEN